MLNCVIVEDERLAREKLKHYIAAHEQTKLIGEFAKADDFIQELPSLNCDILFLDIELPDINGVDLANQFKGHFHIIFTTAYLEYAVEGFELNAIDYLLKPFDYSRFHESVRRVLSINYADKDKTIILKDGKKLYKISLSDIHYIKGLKEYVSWHTPNKKIITLHSLSHIAENLGPRGFVQVHKSYIVQVKKIESMIDNSLEINGALIPIGKTFKKT